MPVSISLRDDVYKRLSIILGNLITKRGKSATYSETVKFLIDFYDKNKSKDE